MLVIGIESSCDDTSIAFVSDDGKIFSNTVSSQISLHNKFGGVVPEIAARAHLDYLDYTFRTSIEQAGVDIRAVNVVAATCGPGLIGGVIVGSTFAKTLAAVYNKPFFAINHLEAHALSARLENKEVKFPYLLFLMSGGHCMICLVRSPKKFEILGKTLDDSVGETFDKVAKMLSLKYPGGPEIQSLAAKGRPVFDLPKPLYKKQGCDMSFSGLKTAVRNLINDQGKITEKFKADVCASFQKVVCDILVQKAEYAINLCQKNRIGVSDIVIGGGVAANRCIREQLNKIAYGKCLNFFAPSLKLCTDNAAMIAWAAIERMKIGDKGDSLEFRPVPRWPLSQ